jgi:hypothetical protein
MNNEPTIKIIRMQTGEDIISSIYEDEETDTVLLNNPMKVILRRMPTGQTIFMMLPWLPIEIVKEDTAVIYASDIITMVEPKDSLIEYYHNAINQNILTMLKAEKELLQQLDEDEDEEGEEYEITEEELQEIEEYKKGKLLH